MKNKHGANFKDIEGQRFGHLQVIGESPITDKKKRVFWICKCDCGNILHVRGDRLRLGETTKCTWCNNGAGKPSRFIKMCKG